MQAPQRRETSRSGGLPSLSGRRNLIAIVTIAVAIVIGLVIGLVSAFGGNGGSSGSGKGSPATLGAPVAGIAALPGAQTQKPPWTPGWSGLLQRLNALGLPALSAEGLVEHIHQHLDIYVNGQAVVVPAEIGINPQGRFISPIHTHDTSGVIHVESPTQYNFRLGQFFGVWGVDLTSRCIGSLCANAHNPLHVYVDGHAFTGDPSRIVLTAHEEIAIVYGKAPSHIPGGYNFPAGL